MTSQRKSPGAVVAARGARDGFIGSKPPAIYRHGGASAIAMPHLKLREIRDEAGRFQGLEVAR